MTQPFVASASAVFCDPANPVSDGSGNNVAAHIKNTSEFAEAPVLKFNQVVTMQDHVMSELGKQSSDTLEIFSKYLTNLAASSTHLDTVQSKNVPRCWCAQFLAWPRLAYLHSGFGELFGSSPNIDPSAGKAHSKT